METEVQENPLLKLVGTMRARLTVADAVWVATASLHRNHPAREAFSTGEIVEMVREGRLTEAAEDSVRTHVRQHCVANKKPQPNRGCVLFDVGGGRRRLVRKGDEVYPGRDAGQRHPRWDELQEGYETLRRWYEEEWEGKERLVKEDWLLALVGSGASIWKDETADEYVANLRANWE